jgi:hypothetical protein
MALKPASVRIEIGPVQYGRRQIFAEALSLPHDEDPNRNSYRIWYDCEGDKALSKVRNFFILSVTDRERLVGSVCIQTFDGSPFGYNQHFSGDQFRRLIADVAALNTQIKNRTRIRIRRQPNNAPSSDDAARSQREHALGKAPIRRANDLIARRPAWG